jgi:hypothetical protein
LWQFVLPQHLFWVKYCGITSAVLAEAMVIVHVQKIVPGQSSYAKLEHATQDLAKLGAIESRPKLGKN